jgi:hypothetical protein
MICRYTLIKKKTKTHLLVNLIRNFKFGATRNFKILEFTFLLILHLKFNFRIQNIDLAYYT